MPAGNTTFTAFTELVTTGIRAYVRGSDIADNVSKHNALYRALNAKGKIRTLDGGISIITPLDYAANSTYQRFAGYGTLNVNPVDVISAGEYQWKQAAVHVAVSGYELRVNTGSNRVIDLVKAKIKNAKRSAANGLAVDLYSDGTAAYQINGLQAIIADTPTNTVGGISGTTFAFWKNVVQSAAAPLQGGSSITPSATTIGQLMRPAYYATTRGTDMPDLIVSSQDYYEFLENSQESLKQYVSSPGENTTTVTGSLVSLRWKKADVVFEGDGIIPLAHMYFINTDYLELVVHEAANWTEGERKQAFNQDAVVIPILWQGNLTCSCRLLQAVVKA